MTTDVLIISTMDGAENCAEWIAGQVGSRVEVAATRRAALAALRRSKFAVVVVEESLSEGDPEWADQVWGLAGLAIPVQINFAISGCARLGREVKDIIRLDAADGFFDPFKIPDVPDFMVQPASQAKLLKNGGIGGRWQRKTMYMRPQA